MPAPLAAIGGTLAKGALTGGRAGLVGAAKAAGSSAISSARSGLVKGKKGGGDNKIKSPINTDVGSVGGGGGAIVPFGGTTNKISSSITPAPKSEVVPAKTVVGGGEKNNLLGVLNQIKSLLDQILQVEREEKSKLEDSILDFVKRDEDQKKDKEEAAQENKKKSSGKSNKKNPIVKAATKSVLGIWGFISGIVGDFIKYKILDWISDPKNKKNLQRILKFFQGMVKFLGAVFSFIGGQLGRMIALVEPQLKIFGAFLRPLLDLLTLKWLTNPGEFLKNILNIPKILFETIPELFKALANFITFGLFENLGKWVGDIISNFNPLKLLGFGKEETEETSTTSEGETQQKPPQEKKTGGGGGVMSMLNPMNWFGGGDKQTVDTESLPKLKEGGIVSPPAGATGAAGVNGSSGADGAKSLTQGSVNVQPLENLIDVVGISQNLMKAMKPFMDMMLAPFKIIGTAIVGLVIKTVGKIPFVGNLINPIIEMAASSFGVPSNVLTLLTEGTKKDKEKKIDKQSLLEKLFSGVDDIKKSVAGGEGGENPLSSLVSGLGSIASSVGGFLSGVFIPPAAAGTRPLPSVMPSTPGSPPGSPPSTPGSPPGSSPTSAASSGGAYGSGLKTGPSSRIGGSSAFHIDTKIKSGLSMKQKVQMMDQLSMGYEQQGRIIEFSNDAVQNKTYSHSMTYDEKSALLTKAFAAHNLPRGRAIDQGGFNSIDYYIPLLKDSQDTGGKGRFRKGAEQAEILVPTIDGGTLEYHKGGNYGSFVHGVDKNGEVLYRTGHGDTSTSANRGTVQFGKNSPLSPAQLATQPSKSKSGAALQSTQQESLNLQSSARGSGKTGVDVYSTDEASTDVNTSYSGMGLGLTLPRDGLFATFKTVL